MKKYAFDVMRALLCSLVILLFLMLPEIVFGFINTKLAVCGNTDKLGALFLLSLALSLVKNKTFIKWFLIVFGVFQLVQFNSMAYFGVYLTPYAIDFIFLETGDIITEIKDVWYKYLYVFALVGVPYWLLWRLIARDILNRVTFGFGWVFPMLYVAAFFYRASTPDGIFQMLFKQTCFASITRLIPFPPISATSCRKKSSVVRMKKFIPIMC